MSSNNFIQQYMRYLRQPFNSLNRNASVQTSTSNSATSTLNSATSTSNSAASLNPYSEHRMNGDSSLFASVTNTQSAQIKLLNSNLLEAIEKGNKNAFEIALSEGADIYVQDNDGNNVLHLCAHNRSKEIIDLLPSTVLQSFVEIENKSNRTPFDIAITGNDTSIVLKLIQHTTDASLNSKCKFGYTKLYYAVRYGHLAAVEEITKRVSYGNIIAKLGNIPELNVTALRTAQESSRKKTIIYQSKWLISLRKN